MSTGQAINRATGYELYYAAIDADQRFHNELARVYGKANVRDARYKATHTDAGVNAAREAKHAADKAWFAHMRGKEIGP